MRYMALAHHLLAWRHYRSVNQSSLADKAGLTRAYLARLETGRADPSLSVLLKLAVALDLSVGALLDQMPPASELTPDELDRLARAVYHPGRKSNQKIPHVRLLARAFQGRRAAMGLYRPRKKKVVPTSRATGQHALRRLRVIVGEKTWAALLRRIDKHAAFQGKVTP
jgi:transcriptional regulator with XRE-family HTH domain